MKKIIGLALVMLSAMVFVPQAAAQYSQERTWQVYQQDDRSNRRNRRNRRYDNRRHNYGYVVSTEYRYVRINHRVYKETYRSTYTRRGYLISRVLIARERVRHYDNYRDNQDGVRFNIFLKF